MKRFKLNVFFFACYFVFTKSVFSAEGDKLFIMESLVNVRSEPSAESDVLLKLKQGREVTEIQRQSNWIKVDLHRDDIQFGWIHKKLLSKVEKSENTTSPTRFEKFKKRFDDHNEVINKQNGNLFFINVLHKGKGDIELIATPFWLSSDMEIRNSSLSEIFTLWSKYVPVGSSLSVQVLDEKGERFTLMMR